jgi:hypothetical protein
VLFWTSQPPSYGPIFEIAEEIKETPATSFVGPGVKALAVCRQVQGEYVTPAAADLLRSAVKIAGLALPKSLDPVEDGPQDEDEDSDD